MSVLTLYPAIAEADWINSTFADIDDVGEKDIDTQVNQVLECIVLEGLQHILSVDRIHKHYDLLQGELPTYSAVGGDFKKLIIRPLPWDSSSFPLSFAITPIGLVTTSMLDAASAQKILRSRMDTILGDKSDSFVKIVTLIRSLHIEPFIGLSFRIDNFSDAAPDVRYNEVSYKNRMQTLTAHDHITEPIMGKYSVTSWYTSGTVESLAVTTPIGRSCRRICHITQDRHFANHYPDDKA